MILPISIIIDLKFVIKLRIPSLSDSDGSIRQLIQMLDRIVTIRVIHYLIMKQADSLRQIFICVVEILAI